MLQSPSIIISTSSVAMMAPIDAMTSTASISQRIPGLSSMPMEAQSLRALAIATLPWYMAVASTSSAATMATIVLMTSTGTTFSHKTGSNLIQPTQSRALVHVTRTRVSFTRIICTYLAAMMATIATICISTTSKLTCGMRFAKMASGQSLAIELQLPCLITKCIYLEVMTVLANLTISTTSTSKLKRGNWLISLACSCRLPETHMCFSRTVPAYTSSVDVLAIRVATSINIRSTRNFGALFRQRIIRAIAQMRSLRTKALKNISISSVRSRHRLVGSAMRDKS